MSRLYPILAGLLLSAALEAPPASVFAQDKLSADIFADPPSEYGIRCWWWWLNGNVTKASITRDLEAMKEKSFSGACIFDAGGHDQQGNGPVPKGPMFGSPEWQELFRFAVKEANRLGLVLSSSIQSGWNLGGPDVTPQESAKHLTWSETVAKGPGRIQLELRQPQARLNFYRDIAVLAFPLRDTAGIRPISRLRHKAAFDEAAFSATDMRHLLREEDAVPGEASAGRTFPGNATAGGRYDASVPGPAHAQPAEVLDISDHMNEDGLLNWDAPAGEWLVLRFGYTNNGSHVSTASGDWQGLVLDYMNASHFNRYWDTWVKPMLESLGPLAGTTLKYLQTDSWELGGINWTEDFREEFRKRRGYDLLPYLPVIAGKIIGSRDLSNRFLADFRKTIADCISDNHYRVFAERAAEFGMGIQPESAGPHAGPFDGLKNYGHSEIIMSEFWSPSGHRPTPERRFFVKQASSAAHIYNKRLVGAEAFTTIGKHWNDVIWTDMKPSFDHSVCEGLNLVYLHTFTSSPPEMGIPGQEYFAGTHFNPNITWWKYSDAFFRYIARCQYLMQQGEFVADALYYYGDHVPNIAILKASDPAGVLPGFDYDVIHEDRLMDLSVVDGRITLPHGMNYRILVLPDHAVLSLEALRKVYELVQAGATVLGPKTRKTVSLVAYPESEKQVEELAGALWGNERTQRGSRSLGRGHIAWGYTAREWLLENGVQPDCSFRLRDTGSSASAGEPAGFDYIHHRLEGTDYYFIRNGRAAVLDAEVTFRAASGMPELWDPVSGRIQALSNWRSENGLTIIPLEFAPYGSCFIVFRQEEAAAAANGGRSKGKASAAGPVSVATSVPGAVASVLPPGGVVEPGHESEELARLEGSWELNFDPRWGGPENVRFDSLFSWTLHPDERIRYYSGSAVYRKEFSFRGSRKDMLWLDLGDVRDVGIARVWLNGKDLGVIWASPFRINVSGLLKRKNNVLEIEVINSWRNRLLGDKKLPPERRLTRTNITVRDEWPLLESGLLGPVRILR